MFPNVLAKASAYFLGKQTHGRQECEYQYAPVVLELRGWVLSDPTRRESFETAIRTARSHDTAEIQDIGCLEDYFHFLDEQLHWVPTEDNKPKDLLFRLYAQWFVLSQPSVAIYQSPIHPSTDVDPTAPGKLSWLSDWMVRFNKELGKFMDTPGSAACVDSFRVNPVYNIDDYLEPRSGWRTFNEFFCRQIKPGRRPIAHIGDDSVVTSPADFQFKEIYPISPESTVTTKGLTWRIAQMLVESPYRARFANGTWLHGYLDVSDYHRIHTPVSGVVVEARTILGQNHLRVEARREGAHSVLDLPNEAGYQFCQARGLVIMDTGAGLVAVLPIGMSMVSSVILTAEVGARLHKGEELGYFQFGGSDAVLIFEDRLNVEITMVPERHYKMGTEIGRLRGLHT